MHDRICFCLCRRAGSRGRACGVGGEHGPKLVNTCGSVWTSPMGPFFLYSWHAFARRLPHNQMGRCSVLPTTPSIRHLRRPERNGSLRVLYAARIGHCRACPLRAQCQESSTAIKPRRVSAVLWPLGPSPSPVSILPETVSQPQPLAPVLWKDWPRCGIRRAWLKVIRSQTMCLESSSPLSPSRGSCATEKIVIRAERAHWRLSWSQRLARNARPSNVPRLVVTLHGLPAIFASSFGFDLLATA
jgi:hypothetical protein